MKEIVCVAIVMLVLAGCCRDSGSCAHQNLDMAFIGWQTTDLDTLVLRRYTAGTTEFIDSSQIAIASFIGHGDTLSPGYVVSSGVNYLSGGYDWSVTLKSGTVYNVFDIEEAGSDGGKDCSIIPFKQKDFCVASVTGYQVDGYHFTNASGLTSVYMHK